MNISPYSLASLFLHPKCQLLDGSEETMSSATGFIVQHEGQYHLITNWHVVSGRSSVTGQALADHAATPTKIDLWFCKMIGPNTYTWIPVSEKLYNEDDKPLWLEHPRYGRKVDAVALPLKNLDGTGASLVWYSLSDAIPQETLAADVPDTVSVIGFPFGEVATGRIAIWVQGSIATHTDIDYGELPCFLIDSRTRRGQSGSPVIAYRGPDDTARMINGATIMGHPVMVRLLGVYSGRINEESDLGKVWKTSAIRDIVEFGIPGNADLVPPTVSD